MLVVGSTALSCYNHSRVPKDYDIVLYRDQVKSLGSGLDKGHSIIILGTPTIDCILADESPALQAYLKYEDAEGTDIKIASLPTLLSLKTGHLHYPLKNFQSHIEDYSWLWNTLKEDSIPILTRLHRDETVERKGPVRTPSLDKSVEEFFGQSVGYVKSWFIHDDVHMVMAHGERPAYEDMQYDKTKAKCDKVLWDAFSFEKKCHAVLEEAYVIALERKLIPKIYGKQESNWTGAAAFRWAMKRICTTLTSGWFRDFACKYYNNIVAMHNPKYYVKFMTAVQIGRISEQQISSTTT